jgi:hypothetical protein
MKSKRMDFSMGFWDDLTNDFDMLAAVEASKDANGKPDSFI